MIENYQSHILKPTEIVDYSAELMNGVRPETIQMEPMIGFKLLTKDMNAGTAPSQAARFQYLEMNLGFLKDTGCIIRETQPIESPDGFWIISFPVPISQLATQLMSITRVMDFIAANFGIVSMDSVEINVSGKCRVGETEWRLANVNIPAQIRQSLIEPSNTPYKLGHIIRINDDFAMLRTMWDWRRSGTTTAQHMSDLLVIPQLISGMFR
jgi:hypothetical protein